MPRWLEQTWWSRRPTLLAVLLQPLAWLMALAGRMRRWLYRSRLLQSIHPGVPVVVVGNIVVGGAGKTPVVQAVIRCLRQAGYRPGIVSRGYPVSPRQPLRVTSRSTAAEVGDEPLLHYALGVPVVVCADRVAAVDALLGAEPATDVVVADDALQHYRLARDIEIEVVSAERRYGNERLLPAGPLREPLARAEHCVLRVMSSWVVPAQGYKEGAHHVVKRRLGEAYALVEPARRTPLSTFRGARPAIVAGIAHPRQFAMALGRVGVDGDLHEFPDHHAFRKRDFDRLGDRTVLMTEKDAAKCRPFADHRMWAVPLTVHFAVETKRKLLRAIRMANERLGRADHTAQDGSETA